MLSKTEFKLLKEVMDKGNKAEQLATELYQYMCQLLLSDKDFSSKYPRTEAGICNLYQTAQELAELALALAEIFSEVKVQQSAQLTESKEQSGGNVT
jgi:hypothetical protein